MNFFPKKTRSSSIEEIRQKIKENYPELTVADKGQVKPLFEQIQLYYQLEAIKSQNLHNWVISIATIVNVILTAINVWLTFFKK